MEGPNHHKQKHLKEEIHELILDSDIKEVKCGIGRFNPKWLQRLACKEVYLAVFCLSAVVMGAVSAYAVATVSTIEKRFQLSSQQAGVIVASNDISQGIFTIILSYYGNYGNRPRVMALSFFASAIFCLMSASPHFIFGYEDDVWKTWSDNDTNSGVDLCFSEFEEACDTTENYGNSSWAALLILFIAQFLFGMSSPVFSSIGFVYLDDNVKRDSSPLYYAISLIIKIGGPIFGLLLGSHFLGYYINFVNDHNFTQTDPQWIGAWWLGYWFLGFLLLACGFALLFFPMSLPQYLIDRVYKEQELSKRRNSIADIEDNVRIYMKQIKENDRKNKPSLKNFPTAMKRLVTNKVYIGFSVHAVLGILSITLTTTFDPKYLEDQFKVTASESTFYIGVTTFISSAIGFILAGLFMRLCKPKARTLMFLGISVIMGNLLLAVALYYVNCPNIQTVIGPSYWPPELGSCNTGCACADQYAPVCGNEGTQTFYSACYAGCQTFNQNGTFIEYGNCRCISTNETFPYEPSGITNVTDIEMEFFGGNVSNGACTINCMYQFYIHIALKCIRVLISSFGLVGRFFVALRSLEQHDKGIALGVQSTLMSLFAFIPGPILMGKIIDTSCLVWGSTCGVQGNCLLYDSDNFRFLIHFVPSIAVIASLIGDYIMLKHCHNVSLYDEPTS